MPIALTTAADLIRDVKSKLGESGNSNFATLSAGDGSSDLITTDDQILLWLNDAAADIAKTVYPVSGYATYASVPIGAQGVAFSAMTTMPTGGTIWAVRQVSYNGVALQESRADYIENWYPTGATDANGVPAYWYMDGVNGVGIAPLPAASAMLVVRGFVTPPLLASGSDTITWIEADHVRLMSTYAATMGALKNEDDGSMQDRIAIWRGLYTAGKTLLAQRLWATDKTTAQRFFPQAVELVKTAMAVGDK